MKDMIFSQKSSPKNSQRSMARLAAVQAIYQVNFVPRSASQLINEFHDYHYSGQTNRATGDVRDKTFFSFLVDGVIRRSSEIDKMISSMLAAHDLERLERVLAAILRVGAYELLDCVNTPAKVVINEYVNLAHAFFDGEQPSLANGVLDALARELRPAEFEDVTN